MYDVGRAEQYSMEMEFCWFVKREFEDSAVVFYKL